MKGLNKNKKKGFIEDNKLLLLFSIIGFGALLKALMFFKSPDLWWDSASYVGIGKYIWTFGEIGFWNPVRPLVLPIILGAFWKLGMNPIFWGRVVQIIVASVSVYFIYQVSERLFKNIKISLLAAFLLAIDPIIFNNTQHLLTSTIAMMFSLISVNYYLISFNNNFSKRELILAGIFAALAFLSRLTFIFIIGSLGLSLLSASRIKKFKDLLSSVLYLSIPFFVTWLPYLILNFILYKNPLYPYIQGIHEIGLAGGAINYPLTYYLTSIPMIASITVLAIPGLYFAFKSFKKEENKLLLLLFLTGFFYHMFLVEVKVLRYTILFLPFLYLLASYGSVELSSKNKLLKILVIVLVVFSVSQTFALGMNNGYAYSISAFLKFSQSDSQEFLKDNFYNYMDKPEYYGATVLSSSPYPVALSDIRLYTFFFPNMVTLEKFEETNQTFYVMINLADNYCDPNMDFCKLQQKDSNEAFDHILLNYEQIYNTSISGNNYFVFRSE